MDVRSRNSFPHDPLLSCVCRKTASIQTSQESQSATVHDTRSSRRMGTNYTNHSVRQRANIPVVLSSMPWTLKQQQETEPETYKASLTKGNLRQSSPSALRFFSSSCSTSDRDMLAPTSLCTTAWHFSIVSPGGASGLCRRKGVC